MFAESGCVPTEKNMSHVIKADPDELNEEVKCELRASPIHGVGVFALRDIRKGKKLFCKHPFREWIRLEEKDFAELYPEVRDVILKRWPLALAGEPFLHPNGDAYLISFMNTSAGGYINYDPHTDTALCDIASGTEVIEDYGMYKDFLLNL